MDRSYIQLCALPPETYLRPDNFTTSLDRPGYDAEQYAKGLRISRESSQVSIAANGTWGCRPRSGGVGTSSEGIGYHAGTAALLRGFLDGPAPLVVYRDMPGGALTATEIKPGTGESAGGVQWCEACQEQRTGAHGAHPSYDEEARLYARELYRLGIHPCQDRD